MKMLEISLCLVIMLSSVWWIEILEFENVSPKVFWFTFITGITGFLLSYVWLLQLLDDIM